MDMKKFLWPIGFMLFVAGCSPRSVTPEPLKILCGSSMEEPARETGKRFTKLTGIGIEFHIGRVELLSARILRNEAVDLFICHDPFEQKVKDGGHEVGSVALGYLEPVVLLRRGNPKKIKGLADLARKDIQIGIGDPRYSACGQMFMDKIKERGLYSPIMSNVVLRGRAHPEVVAGLVTGPLDAVVIWNYVAKFYEGRVAERMPMDEKYPEIRVTILGLSQSPNPKARDAFLRFCNTPEVQGLFKRHGYEMP